MHLQCAGCATPAMSMYTFCSIALQSSPILPALNCLRIPPPSFPRTPVPLHGCCFALAKIQLAPLLCSQDDFSDFAEDKPVINDQNVLSHNGYEIQLPDGDWEVVRDAEKKEYYICDKAKKHPPKWVSHLLKLKRARKCLDCMRRSGTHACGVAPCMGSSQQGLELGLVRRVQRKEVQQVSLRSRRPRLRQRALGHFLRLKLKHFPRCCPG